MFGKLKIRCRGKTESNDYDGLGKLTFAACLLACLLLMLLLLLLCLTLRAYAHIAGCAVLLRCLFRFSPLAHMVSFQISADDGLTQAFLNRNTSARPLVQSRISLSPMDLMAGAVASVPSLLPNRPVQLKPQRSSMELMLMAALSRYVDTSKTFESEA